MGRKAHFRVRVATGAFVKLTARFPVLTPAWSETGTVDYVQVAICDIRVVLEVQLPTRRRVPGDPQMSTDRAIELVMSDGQRTPALFGRTTEVSKWVRADREGHCPNCYGQNAHSNIRCSDTLTPSTAWSFDP